VISRLLVRIVIGAVAVVVALAAWDVATYDAKAWRADFEHLKREMAQRYANLDWIVSQRRLDVRALDAETSAAIDNAHSRVFAFLAVRRFIRTFNDPHLRLVFADRSAANTPAAAVPSTSADDAAGPSCEDAGYEASDTAFRFGFDQFDGWTPLRSGHFPTGIARDAGVLRIASFGEDQYSATCRAVFRPGIGARALQLAVRTRLQQALSEAINDLKSRSVRYLVVDISGNGGGTEWVTEVVGLLTDRVLVRQASRLVAPACDRSGIWRGEAVCPVLAPAGEPIQLQGAGVWSGPMVILVDQDTGSAAEDFVAWLQQNDVAVVAGTRTAGAGCGYVNGGGRITLKEAPFDVMAPNCARFLNDGTNEIEGIKPDFAAPKSVAELDRYVAR